MAINTNSVDTLNLVSLTEEWQRFEMTFSAVGSSFIYPGSARADAGDVATLTQAYVWGPQCEIGDFASSYIKNTGVGDVTRAATDLVADQNTVHKFSHQTRQGTLVTHGRQRMGGVGTGASAYIFQLDDNGTADRFLLRADSTAANLLGQSFHSADTDGSVSISYSADDTEFGVAITWEDDNFNMALNGTDGSEDTTAAFPLGDTIQQASLGNRNGGADPWFGVMRDWEYYNVKSSGANRRAYSQPLAA
jgi:hypothetical protein